MRNISMICLGIIMAVCVLEGCNTVSTVPRRIGPSIRAFRAVEPPAVDGLLNDAAWLSAEAVQLKAGDGEGGLRFPTIVRMLWDDTYLYVGFECRDTDAAGTVHGRDSAVGDGEFVSIAIDADADSVTYCSITVAPTGAVLDAYHIGRADGVLGKTMKDWNCEGLRVSVSVYGDGASPGNNDRFWTVELAIPYEELYTAYEKAPQAGDYWRVDACRREMTGEDMLSTLTTRQHADRRAPLEFAWLIFGG